MSNIEPLGILISPFPKLLNGIGAGIPSVILFKRLPNLPRGMSAWEMDAIGIREVPGAVGDVV